MALAQIGEFSFILATLGRDLGILTAAATNALVAASIVSIVLNPLAYRAIGPARALAAATAAALGAAESRGCAVGRRDDRVRSAGVQHESPPPGRRHRLRPDGRAVVRLLRDNGIAPTVVELNMDAVRMLRHDGIDAVYGDATRPETLEAAGVARAGSLILGSAGMAHSAEVIRTAQR